MCPGSFLPHPSTGTAPQQDSAASQPGCCVDTSPGTRAQPAAWGCSEGGNRAGCRPCREELSPGVPRPLPSTDCTDTNFILQVLEAQKRGPPAAPPPCTAVGKGLTRPCPWQCLHAGGGAVLGTPQPPGLCPLGRVPAPAGDAAVAWLPGWVVPCSKPLCWGGLSSLRADPASILAPVKPVQEPPRDGDCPLGFPHPAGLQLSSHRGLWGHSGDHRDRARDSDRRQGRGWRGRLQGSAGLRTAWPRWGHTAAGARWTGRSWPL